MIRMTFLPYFLLIVICAISTACVSGGVDPNEQQASFAGAPLEGNLEENLNSNFAFGDDLDQNFNNLENSNFDNAFFNNVNEFGDNGANNGFNNFGNFEDFGDGESVNSVQDDFFNNFGLENQAGGNNFFNDQNFQNNNFFAEDGGLNAFGDGNNNFFFNNDENFAFQGDNPLQFNDNNAGFSMFEDGEGINNALPDEDEFGMFANQSALDTNINPVVDQAASETLEPMQMMDGTGLVKYVTASGSTLHTEKNGNVLRNLEQGDHPLVFDEGEWSRTSDGYYIPSMTLTTDPIPRRKLKAIWTY